LCCGSSAGRQGNPSGSDGTATKEFPPIELFLSHVI